MKKSMLVLTLLFIIISTTCVLAGECTDSDGKDFTTYGEVTEVKNGNTYIEKDECLQTDGINPRESVSECSGYGCFIMENFCIGVKASLTSTSCEAGCRNGACSVTKPEKKCIDSDGGINPKTYGFVTSDITGKLLTHEDTCHDDDELDEHYCEGSDPHGKRIKCSDLGLKCRNGVCTSGDGLCDDSDKGKNYYLKGLTTDNLGKNAGDCCKSSDSLKENCGSTGVYLHETYCADDNSMQRVMYKCPQGCNDGSCLPFIEEAEEIEIPVQDEVESAEECPEKSCKVISEKCSGIDRIVVEECKYYINTENQCDEIRATNTNLIKSGCSEEETTEKLILCQGCQLNEKKCIPFGTRLKKNDMAYYCNIDGKMEEQARDEIECQNSYECISNNCKGELCKPVCDGCLDSSSNCIPYGTRTETQFCDIDHSFKNQKSKEGNCNNNYECSTNVCVNNQCISPNLIQKIINWFNTIFG